jgi:preprotein translocase subunit YajC
MTLLFIPALLLLMYFFLIRPQQQRVRRQRELMASIDVGDDIVTAGGMIGRIVSLSADRAEIEVAEGVTIEFLRAAISRKLEEPVSYASYGSDDDSGESDDAPTDSPPVGEHDSPPEDSH